MGKRVKKPTDQKTLGQLFGDERYVSFTILGALARLAGSDIECGYEKLKFHLKAGNIVHAGEVGIYPGVPVYRIANPDAPAIP